MNCLLCSERSGAIPKFKISSFDLTQTSVNELFGKEMKCEFKTFVHEKVRYKKVVKTVLNQ